MEEHSCGFQYRSDEAYPAVQVSRKNRQYGEIMLSNLAGASSEMSAVTLYVYDQLITAELPEIAEVFHQISMVEMHHLELFGTLARQLGVDPRLWSRQGGRMHWWSAGCLGYTSRLGEMLRIALREEQKTIRRYEQQCRLIRDRYIVDCLERVILDEKLHVDIFRSLCETYTSGDRLFPG